MELKVKKLKTNAIFPRKGTQYSAGVDLHACLDNEELLIRAGETEKVTTGIAAEIPIGYFGAVFARSSVATKFGLRPANCVGVIDSDYRGELIVALHNDNDETDILVQDGDRIAQLVVIPYMDIDVVEVDTLPDTERGTGGFGSTGM